MTYDIRPLSFSEILDRSFRVYRDNFLSLFAISAVLAIPVEVLAEIAQPHAPKHFLVIFALGSIFVTLPIQHAALTSAISRVYVGQSISVSEAYKAVWMALFRIVGTYYLVAALLLLGLIPLYIGGALVVLVVGIALAAIGLRVSGGSVAPFVAFGVPLVSIVGIGAGLMFVRWSLFVPVMMIEGCFGRNATRRSRLLVHGVIWRTLGIVLAATLITFLPFSLGFIWRFIPVVGILLGALTRAATVPYGIVVMVIYYFDRRCRLEDFDIRLLAEQVRADSHPSIEAIPNSSSVA